LIYGGFHLHFFFRIRSAFAMGNAVGSLLVILLLIGLTAPFIIRFAEGHDFYLGARFMSLIGYYWMAFLMLFCAVSLFIEMYHFIVSVLASNNNIRIFALSAVMRFVIPAAASIILVIYGSFEARSLRTEFLVIRSARIHEGMKRIRVLQISDVHIGGAAEDRHVAKIIRAAHDLAPDIIVSTGDLIDGKGPYVQEAAFRFRELRPKWGKYAVTGNHEFYLGVDKASEFMKQAEFTLLRDRAATVAGMLNLVGVDDPGGIVSGDERSLLEKTLLSGARCDHFTILLKHRPVVEKSTIGFFDLQLSGHTHKGQIFPFCVFTKMVFPYHAGDYILADGSLLHVNRGAGVWGPPIRILAPPEITEIDLMPKEDPRSGS
jgi:predicted MPP superfamily phosphohydrolase